MDLTPLFNQCTKIVLSELKSSVKPPKKNHNAEFIVDDTFIKECGEFDAVIDNLERFVTRVKPTYQDIDNFSVDEKTQVDQDFSIQMQKMYQKLKLLQEYENKREQVTKAPRKGVIATLLGDVLEKELWQTQVATHRTQILKYLNIRLNAVSKLFDAIQRKRMQRERQLNLLNFQNIDDDGGMDTNNQDYAALLQEEEQRHQLAAPQFTDVQVQQLEQENKELLALKLKQLKLVEQLHTLMVDIVNLQAELTFQLETQADQIDNLMDAQLQMEVDVTLGNKEMRLATRRNKRAANILVTLIYCIGVLILVVDFVKFI